MEKFDFGKRLKALRKSADVTQAELADSLNERRATLSNYENKNVYPGFNMLIKLADYFHVSVDYLTGRSDDYEVNSVGGQTTIDFSHKHSYSGTTDKTENTSTVRYGDDFNAKFPAIHHSHTYSGNTEYAGDTKQNILPPYYALCYIMKVTQISN